LLRSSVNSFSIVITAANKISSSTGTVAIEVDMTSGCDADGDMIKDSADELGRKSLLELKSERDGLS
jgi:hypothetical protein